MSVSKTIEYNAVTNFLYNLGKQTDSSMKSIINNRELGGSYYLKEENVEEFFQLYEAARESGSVMSIQESMRTTQYSGIVIDLDILTKEKIKVNLNSLLNICIQELVTVLGVNALKSTIFVTKKPEALIDDNGNVRDGLHIIFPLVKTSAGLKSQYLKNLAESRPLSELFKRRVNDMTKLIDQNMSYTQVFLFGSSKVTEPHPYGLYKVIKFDCSASPISISMEDKTNDVKTGGFNISWLMSILYAKNARVYSTTFDTLITIKPKVDNETKLANLLSSDPEVQFILSLIDIIDPQIFIDTPSWKTFVKAIANINLKYKPLAIYGSQKESELFNMPKTLKFINEYFSNDDQDSEWGKGKLINWAKEYNPVEFEKIKQNDILQQARNDVFITRGRITDERIAKLLVRHYAGKWVSTFNASAGKVQWFRMHFTNAHAYKWGPYHPGATPSELENTLSADIASIFTPTFNHLERISAGGDVPTKKVAEALERYMRNCEQFSAKRGIIATLRNRLDVEDFNLRLDQNPYVLGVNGGVLVLSDQKGVKPRFIQSLNNYNVSINIGRTYKEYDPEDEYIKEVYKILREGFYIDKKEDVNNDGYDKETCEFILYYYCQGLLAKQKKPLLLDLHGSGRNFKSTLKTLVQNTFGEQKTVSFNASYLSEEMPPPEAPHPNAMQMVGKNYIAFDETQKGRILNEGKLKWLLSPGEKKTIRTLHKDIGQYMIHGILTIYANYNLIVESNIQAIWQRLLYCHMKRTFVPHPDPKKPWEKKINSWIIETWVTLPHICDAFFSILTYYLYKLVNEYDGDVMKVPHDRIKSQTKLKREENDLVEKYISSKMVPLKGIKKDGYDSDDIYSYDYVNTDDDEESDKITMGTIRDDFILWHKVTDGSKNITPKFATEKILNSRMIFDSNNVLMNFRFKD